MPLATGVVEAISVKPLDTPDQYANTHRGSLKIGDDWFSFGIMKDTTTTEIYTAVDRSYLQKIHRRHHPRGGAQKGGKR